MAQLRRLSIDFLTSNQLDSLYASMIDSSTKAGSEFLIYQPSAMFQLEFSYFFDGEIITFLLHMPTVPTRTILRLIKLHHFPMPLSGKYSILPDIKNQVLAISSAGKNISLQFPSINLLGCNQTNHVYLCEKLGILRKNMTRTCLRALYKQKFDLAIILCPMKIVTSGKISYRQKNNKYLIYSPIGQTILIPFLPWPTTSLKDLYLQEFQKFNLKLAANQKWTTVFCSPTTPSLQPQAWTTPPWTGTLLWTYLTSRQRT